MKKIIYVASIMLATVFTGCEDFLSVQSVDKLTGDSFWRDSTDVSGALASVYSQIEYIPDAWSFPEVKFPVEAYREDLVLPGVDARNYQNWMDLFNFTYTQGNSQLAGYWIAPYKGINFCNQIFEKMTKVSDASFKNPNSKKQMLDEAHFMRGFFHMKLLMNWEKIIVRDSYIKSEKELDKSLSSRTDAWNFIIEDLKIATSLPQKHLPNAVGRATSGAAYAYLGFAYLTRAYEETAKKNEYLDLAVKAFDNVKGYELESQFLSMFNGTNKNCKESILEVQFVKDAVAKYTTALSKWVQVAELGEGYDEITPNTRLLNEFKKEGRIALDGNYDKRAYETMFFKDSYFNDASAGRVYGSTFDETFSDPDRLAFRKFLPRDKELLTVDMGDVNVMLMRYANVLLLKAEALNELKRTAEAIPLINSVRSVHGNMPPMVGTSYDAVKAQIEHERILEFPLENSRFFDLRRWGKTQEALKAVGRTFNPAVNNFYPIPQIESTSNSGM